MTKNRARLAIIILGMTLMLSTQVFGDELEGHWQQDSVGWKYQLEDGAYLKNEWLLFEGSWYYLNHNEYMNTGWNKVMGNRFCFNETGQLETGWQYDEEEEAWHYYRQDGTMQTGWFHYDGSWYWFNKRGEMADKGYKSIDGARYYFLENGQMAQNQYVGSFYMDENGQHDERYDIQIEGKGTSIPKDVKEQITKALQNVPREWIRRFAESGWKILYYPDKTFFAAPDTNYGVYYMRHKLDTDYRKLKFTRPEALTQAFGEYICYAYGCDEESDEGISLMTGQAMVSELIELPDYYSDDLRFYFGVLSDYYLKGKDQVLFLTDTEENAEETDVSAGDNWDSEGLTNGQRLKEAAPEIYETLEHILYALRDREADSETEG